MAKGTRSERRLRKVRLGCCVECHDWVAGGRVGVVPSRCELCTGQYMREWFAKHMRENRYRFPSQTPAARRRRYYANHERIRAQRKVAYQRRGTDLQRSLGVTQRTYDELLSEQGGVCAICEQQPTRQRLHVDHNHDTGRVRGLLCAACNRGIGSLGDDRDRVLRAAEYLA